MLREESHRFKLYNAPDDRAGCLTANRWGTSWTLSIHIYARFPNTGFYEAKSITPLDTHNSTANYEHQ